MNELGPAEFSAATGLSAKALRLYEERGLLCPAEVDAATGYRRYGPDQVTRATRIALLRRAGLGLAEIARFLEDPKASTITTWLAELDTEAALRRRALEALAVAMALVPRPAKEDIVPVVIRPVDSQDELVRAFDVAGAQVRVPVHHSDRNRFDELAEAYPADRELFVVAEAGSQIVGAALGFRSDQDNVGLRILAVVPEHRGQGVGRSLLQSFEAGTRRLGATRIALGADEEAGFYVRQGYQTMLLLQWVYGPERFEDDVAAIVAGPAAGMDCRRSSFREVPQLFIDLDEPNPALRVQIGDLASGAHVGYCMMKVMTPKRAGG